MSKRRRFLAIFFNLEMILRNVLSQFFIVKSNIKNQFKKNYHFMWLLTTYCTKTHSRIALTFWGGKHGLNLLSILFSALFKWFCFI